MYFHGLGDPGTKKIQIKTRENDTNYQKLKNNYNKANKMHRAPEDRFARTPKRTVAPMEEVQIIKVCLSLVLHVYI